MANLLYQRTHKYVYMIYYIFLFVKLLNCYGYQRRTIIKFCTTSSDKDLGNNACKIPNGQLEVPSKRYKWLTVIVIKKSKINPLAAQATMN